MRGRWEEMASFLCFKQRLQSITMTTRNNNERIEENASVLEETGKVLASCSYEDYTQWGKEMGLKYGCPVEDTLTGLSIQCREIVDILLDVAVYIETYSLKGVTVLGSFAE
ncbi:hypothetical protein VitviT2T_005884 [Vitis vinifera]|uniref:Uncharacterized protein n=1 Tax=Vitis vinifera TaxID=29760 RepID=A0ABY9BU15_VITVI|nr:hypothetical protein VitviT2T_005884 [Vitis vinifera]